MKALCKNDYHIAVLRIGWIDAGIYRNGLGFTIFIQYTKPVVVYYRKRILCNVIQQKVLPALKKPASKNAAHCSGPACNRYFHKQYFKRMEA